MVRNCFRPGAWILLALCAPAFGFQSSSSGPLISITPRRTASAPVPTAAADIRVDSPLVVIPAQVTTEDGASVTDLARENFQIFEDGVERPITYFAKDDAPLSVGLVFDSSGSMHDKMRKTSEAAAMFFKTANAGDEFFLVEFNERPKLAVPFTSNSDVIYQRIAHTRPFGRTSLLDAIYLALEQMKSAHNSRKAIVILSDGGDNRSRYTETEIKNATLESGVQVYSMGIFDSEDSHKLTPEEQNGPHLLSELAEQTGGRDYAVESADDLAGISARISEALRNEYVIGYPPADRNRDGKYHHVTMKVSSPAGSPALRVDYRRGYYSPVN